MNNYWHERFSTDEYMYGKEANAFVRAVAEKLPEGGKVLCIAEGEGRNAVYLATLGFDVTAWDYAQAGLDKTVQLAKEHHVSVNTELRDLADVHWDDEQWDVIVHIFGHTPKQVMDRTLAGVKKALRPGGYYVSELYTKEQLAYGTGGPSHSDMLIDPKEMLSQFEGFFIHHFYVGQVHRIEGSMHTGDSHVVQSLFRKRER